jgi:hypothetical protein
MHVQLNQGGRGIGAADRDHWMKAITRSRSDDNPVLLVHAHLDG